MDDHPLVREWLTNLINQQPDLKVCGEAENAPAALTAIPAARAELAMVDLNLANSSGIELIKDLKDLHPGVPVLVLSMHDESLYAERVFRAGARGYVNKRETANKVIEAIRRVLDGKLYIGEKTAEILAGRAMRGQAADRSAIEMLSDRELQVFQLIGRGHGTRQIAGELCISAKTVESYRAHIKIKMDLKNAHELTQHAVHWVESNHLN